MTKVASAKKIYRTMRGDIFNMDEFVAKHGDVRAVGNAKMNARGDVLNSDGTVLARRDQIAQHYNSNLPKKVENVSFKPLLPDSFDNPEEAMKKLMDNAIKIEDIKTLDPIDTTAPVRRRKIVETDD